jgi:hypothetical protein
VKTRLRRLVPALATLVLLSLPGVAAARDGTAFSTGHPPGEAAAAKLAATYAPITMLREQRDPPCEKTAEQYEPTSVETVLGNPTVTLTHEVPGKGLEDVMKAPTADDIAGLPDGYYLNLEGKVLGDTCVYAKAFAKLVDEGRAPAVT